MWFMRDRIRYSAVNLLVDIAIDFVGFAKLNFCFLFFI